MASEDERAFEQQRFEDLNEAFLETNLLLQKSVQRALQRHAERQQTVLNQWKVAFGNGKDFPSALDGDLSNVPFERHSALTPHVSTWSGVRKASAGQAQDSDLKGHLALEVVTPSPIRSGFTTPRDNQKSSERRPSQEGKTPGQTPPSKASTKTNLDYAPRGAGSTYATKQTLHMENGSELRKFMFRRFHKVLAWWYSLHEPPREGLLASIVKSPQFNFLVISVIFANCFYQWHQANEGIRAFDEPDKIGQIEVMFGVFYTFEVIFKLVVHRAYYFCNEDMSWNMFDFFLVTVGALDLIIRASFQGATQKAGSFKVAFLRVLRILRLARILRGLKALRFFSELRLMLSCLATSVASLFWSIVMLVFIFYIFGLIFVQGATGYLQDEWHNIKPDDRELLLEMYGSVERAMLTLYMASTGGNDWSVYFNVLQPITSKCVFLFFVSFIQIALLNILTGIFVENALKAAEPDLEAQSLAYRKDEAEDAEVLCRVCEAMGIGGEDHSISRAEFAEAFEDNKLRAYMSVLGLRFDDPMALYDLLIMTVEADGEELRQEDFVTGCIRLKGHASNMDMHLLKDQLFNMHRTIAENQTVSSL